MKTRVQSIVELFYFVRSSESFYATEEQVSERYKLSDRELLAKGIINVSINNDDDIKSSCEARLYKDGLIVCKTDTYRMNVLTKQIEYNYIGICTKVPKTSEDIKANIEYLKNHIQLNYNGTNTVLSLGNKTHSDVAVKEVQFGPDEYDNFISDVAHWFNPNELVILHPGYWTLP